MNEFEKRVRDAIVAANDDDLAKEDMVYQVWNDGEVTLQKAGDLLWQRSLHMMNEGLPMKVPADWFPRSHGQNGYVFCTKPDALKVRVAIIEWAQHELQTALEITKIFMQ